jgi:hypothetical protein
LSDPTKVKPGLVTLEVEWLGAINSFDEGELALCQVKVQDPDNLSQGIDPETVVIMYEVDNNPPTEIEWLYDDWDGTTVPFPVVATGVLGRTNQGKFQTWLDTTGHPGEWIVEASTTGAGQGTSEPLRLVVTEKIGGA